MWKHPTLTGLVCLLLGALVLPAGPAQAGDTGEQIVLKSCAECHAVKKPDDEFLTIDERMNRKGPPLYYAGQKYRAEWLKKWLKKPERITPGGVFFANATEVTDDGDEIVDTKLSAHAPLGREEAEEVADYLMTLRPFPERTDKEEFKPGKLMRVLAEKDFRSFKGCAACHRDAPDFGGVSGPELYTAFERLQPEYMISYTRNPTLWEPRSLMPNRHLPDEGINKLVNYLKMIAEEQK